MREGLLERLQTHGLGFWWHGHMNMDKMKPSPTKPMVELVSRQHNISVKNLDERCVAARKYFALIICRTWDASILEQETCFARSRLGFVFSMCNSPNTVDSNSPLEERVRKYTLVDIASSVDSTSRSRAQDTIVRNTEYVVRRLASLPSHP